MIKIKRFKIPVRAHEILRRAKKRSLNPAQMGWATAADAETYFRDIHSHVQPAVLYETFAQDAPLSSLSPVPGVAFSVGVATIGQGLSGLIQTLQASSEASRAEWVAIAQEIALEETVQFALSLTEEEAKQEKCELSPIGNITDGNILQSLFAELDTEKIGVSWKEELPYPTATSVFSVSWLSKRKQRKGLAQK